MLRDKKGDLQARAELLTKLLTVGGEQPLLLKIGAGMSAPIIVMVPTSDTDQAALATVAGSTPVTIPYNGGMYVPLDLRGELSIGSIDDGVYDPATKAWAAETIPLTVK